MPDMAKIRIDRGRCSGIGLCEAVAPHCFEVGDDGWVHLVNGDDTPAEMTADIDAAITNCPTAALSKHE